MELLFTPDVQAAARVLDDAPPPRGMTPWQGVPVRRLSYGGNHIYSQRIERDHYRLMRFHLILDTPVQLVPRVRQHTLACAFLLRGGARGIIHGVTGIQHFRPEHCYIPLLTPGRGAESLVEADAGVCEAIVVLLDRSRETAFLKLFPQFTADSAQLREHSRNGLPYDPFLLTPEMRRLLALLTNGRDAPERLPFVADRCVSGLILAMHEALRQQELQPADAYRIHAYLCAHLGERITTARVASALHMSRKQLCALVKQHFGKTFRAYLAGLRTERARSLLTQEELQLQDIALELGYSSKAHFSSAFRAATGISPSAFRTAALQKKPGI